MAQDKDLNTKPIILGEVLYDHFPDGSAILGGAPFNVAWHLQGLGDGPVFVSCVGQDAEGEHILQQMQEWQMSREGICVTGDHPTGQVQVSIQDNEPSYEIVPDQAYDNLQKEAIIELESSKSDFALLYHGTLAMRTQHMKEFLDQFKKSINLPVFMDVNLRDPWWELSYLKQVLQESRWVKLNRDELQQLSPQGSGNIQSQAQQIFDRYKWELLIVTLGADGAVGINQHQSITVSAPEPASFQDAVGAGDAFSAVIIHGLLKHWPLETMLERAAQFASLICSQKGATAHNKELYQKLMGQWGQQEQEG